MVAPQRLAPAVAGALAFAVYAVTVAPTVTLWDAGEFIAAIETLGIPHPPGTPLFVVVARVWSDALGILPRALATNLFSAVATAAAVALAAWIVGSGSRRWLAAAAAAVCAGVTATVWSNATETEVYGASLALSLTMVAAGERAGRSRDARWHVLIVYLFALAVPLHMSALVAAPGAVALASVDDRGRFEWRSALLLGGAAIAAAGAGTVSPLVLIVGVAVMAVGTLKNRRRCESAGGAGKALEDRPESSSSSAIPAPPAPFQRPRSSSAIPALFLRYSSALALGLSPLLILLVRSAHDPALDAGNPETWQGLLDVIARRQYAPAGLWPRQAPLWIQVGNLFEYLDWQFAMGLDPGVAPSWMRTPITAVFAGLGLTGSVYQARDDRRTWVALVTVFVCATLGLVVYMNFKAGASFAWNFVPESARHEVRERDYFFALGFFVWGAWAGYGAVRLASGRGIQWLGVAVACLPIAFNWRVANRRREPEASLASVAARAWLAPLPQGAVLVTGGDNDSFPLWYLQLVEGARPDVVVVTAPLIGAPWYGEEIAARYGLLPPGAAAARMTHGERLRAVASHAERRGRPLRISAFVDSASRAQIGRSWTFDGLTFSLDDGPVGTRLDARRASQVSRVIPPEVLARDPLDTPDRAPRFVARRLQCASLIGRWRRSDDPPVDSLDSWCNLR